MNNDANTTMNYADNSDKIQNRIRFVTLKRKDFEHI